MFLTGGARFFWPETLNGIISFPQAWDASLNTGVGQSGVNMLWINSYLSFSAFFTKLGLSWNGVIILLWLLPAVLIGSLSIYKLFSFSFPDVKRYGVLSGILYLLNTYFLLIFFGGQLGVIFAYALLPLFP